jgi:hypothetical protein
MFYGELYPTCWTETIWPSRLGAGRGAISSRNNSVVSKPSTTGKLWSENGLKNLQKEEEEEEGGGGGACVQADNV